MIDYNVGVPGNGSIETQTLPPVDVPEAQWLSHPILSRAQLTAAGDALEWPDASVEQLTVLREITLARAGDQLVARVAPQFNFDRFVDSTFNEEQSVPPIGRVDDAQRYYTRVTDNGFHVVGVFTAVTIAGRRRYFQWLTNTWVEIGQSGFLYVRDDLDTHFSEVEDAQLEQYQPGATITDVPVQNEQWSMEHFEARFGAHAAMPAPETMEPVLAGARTMSAHVAEPVEAHASAPAPVSAPYPFAPPVTVAESKTAPAPVSAPAPVAPPAPSAPPMDVAVINPSPMPESDARAQQGIASALATIAHRGQLDRIGAAYIDHPARVAERFDWRNEPIHHAAAWLHSVMEDSDITEQDLREAGIRPEIVSIVSVLTRRSDVSDVDYYAAINADPIARAVKLADIADNSAPWRARRLDPESQAEFAARHAVARTALGAAPGE